MDLNSQCFKIRTAMLDFGTTGVAKVSEKKMGFRSFALLDYFLRNVSSLNTVVQAREKLDTRAHHSIKG